MIYATVKFSRERIKFRKFNLTRESIKRRHTECIIPMAVPGRRNGFNEDDDEESNGIFEEQSLAVEETDTPPHLRDLSHAAQTGDLSALRLALGNYLSLTFSFSPRPSFSQHNSLVSVLLFTSLLNPTPPYKNMNPKP